MGRDVFNHRACLVKPDPALGNKAGLGGAVCSVSDSWDVTVLRQTPAYRGSDTSGRGEGMRELQRSEPVTPRLGVAIDFHRFKTLRPEELARII